MKGIGIYMGLEKSGVKGNFVRRVANNVMIRDEISEFFLNDTDVDKINHIMQVEVVNSEIYSNEQTAGCIIKSYFEGCTIGGGGQTNGLTIFFKNSATITDGGKTAIAAFHGHDEATGTIDFGLRIFGDFEDDVIQFAVSSAVDGIDMALSTLSGVDIRLSKNGEISDTDDSELIIKKIVKSGDEVTAGVVIKSYMENADVTFDGNSEFCGLSVFAKHIASDLGASIKSTIVSLHEHGDSTGTWDYLMRMFFTTATTGFFLTGDLTYLFEFLQGSEGVSTGSSKSTPGTVDKWLDILIAGVPYYIPCYTSKTS